MKIGLEITSIEVYLIGLFFGVLSVFKERIRSNLVMIHDQSGLNWIAIESKRGDHEELRILLKKCLSFTIQSRVTLQRKNIGIYKEIPCEN